MDIEFPVNIEVYIDPIGRPNVTVSSGHTVYSQIVTEPTRFKFDYVTSGSSSLHIIHQGKLSNDSSTAVIIKKISFFGISDPKFIWNGIYTPDYPEPWYSQQTPLPNNKLTNTDYLGWNGAWRLDFSIPVFSWIHETLNLGWIYR